VIRRRTALYATVPAIRTTRAPFHVTVAVGDSAPSDDGAPDGNVWQTHSPPKRSNRSRPARRSSTRIEHASRRTPPGTGFSRPRASIRRWIEPSRTTSGRSQPPTDAEATDALAITLTLPYHASDDERTHRLRIEPFVHDDAWYASLSVADERPDWARSHLKERAMDEAPVGITISDYTVPDNPLIYANAAFERITGYDVTAVLGRNCRFLQCPATNADTIDRFGTAIVNNEATTIELRNERKDGEPFWNAVTVAPLRDAQGTVTNWVGFQQDVTDRKETEAALSTERDQYALEPDRPPRHPQRRDGHPRVGVPAPRRTLGRRYRSARPHHGRGDPHAGTHRGGP
jgi:PAS domain S-box-containing protein